MCTQEVSDCDTGEIRCMAQNVGYSAHLEIAWKITQGYARQLVVADNASVAIDGHRYMGI